MIHTVNEFLYWGDVWSVEDAAKMCDAVLNVGVESYFYKPPEIEYKIKFFDDIDPFPYEDMWECVLWIDEKVSEKKKVYVHCLEGNSRSVSTIIAYLHHNGMDFDEACDLILSIKPRLTMSGEYTDTPQFIRPWFKRDWPSFIHRNRLNQ